MQHLFNFSSVLENIEWPQICDNFLRNARTGDQNEMFCKGDFKTHCQG